LFFFFKKKKPNAIAKKERNWKGASHLNGIILEDIPRFTWEMQNPTIKGNKNIIFASLSTLLMPPS